MEDVIAKDLCQSLVKSYESEIYMYDSLFAANRSLITNLYDKNEALKKELGIKDSLISKLNVNANIAEREIQKQVNIRTVIMVFAIIIILLK